MNFLTTKEWNSFPEISSSFKTILDKFYSSVNCPSFKEQFEAICNFSGPLENKICGRIFEIGEVLYCCKTCAYDATCVLCEDCFCESDHAGHQISFSISQGSGGCCDCGDRESWKIMKSKPCSHSSEHDTKHEKPIVTKDFIAKFSSSILILIDAIMVAFRTESECDLSQEDDFCIVFYNDEAHSFEQVIKLLTSSLGITRNEARNAANDIDSFGRNVVYRGVKEECDKRTALMETSLFYRVIPFKRYKVFYFLLCQLFNVLFLMLIDI